jgi:hypothetical protein
MKPRTMKKFKIFKGKKNRIKKSRNKSKKSRNKSKKNNISHFHGGTLAALEEVPFWIYGNFPIFDKALYKGNMFKNIIILNGKKLIQINSILNKEIEAYNADCKGPHMKFKHNRKPIREFNIVPNLKLDRDALIRLLNIFHNKNHIIKKIDTFLSSMQPSLEGSQVAVEESKVEVKLSESEPQPLGTKIGGALSQPQNIFNDHGTISDYILNKLVQLMTIKSNEDNKIQLDNYQTKFRNWLRDLYIISRMITDLDIIQWISPFRGPNCNYNEFELYDGTKNLGIISSDAKYKPAIFYGSKGSWFCKVKGQTSKDIQINNKYVDITGKEIAVPKPFLKKSDDELKSIYTNESHQPFIIEMEAQCEEEGKFTNNYALCDHYHEEESSWSTDRESGITPQNVYVRLIHKDAIVVNKNTPITQVEGFN